MSKQRVAGENNRNYRARLRAAGAEEVLFQLPTEIVALIDELKQRHGLRSRSQVLVQLIEQGMAAAQQMS